MTLNRGVCRPTNAIGDGGIDRSRAPSLGRGGGGSFAFNEIKYYEVFNFFIKNKPKPI
jgi:hypothetical protein